MKTECIIFLHQIHFSSFEIIFTLHRFSVLKTYYCYKLGCWNPLKSSSQEKVNRFITGK